MTYSNTPASPEGHKHSTSNAVSLEQLLALRQKKNEKTEASTDVRESVDASEVEVQREQPVDQSLPLILVVHVDQMQAASAKQKLRCITDEVSLQWLSVQEQIVEYVQLMQPHAVMIQFASNALDEATVLAKQLHQMQQQLPVFAWGSAQESKAMLWALRAGVQDFLDIDAADQEIHERVKTLLAKGKHPEVKPSAVGHAPLVVLMSAREGVGSSLLAAHLAVFLQTAFGHSARNADQTTAPAQMETLLLDLGAPAGDGALYLDLVSEFDFMEAVQSLRRLDQKMVSAGFAQHVSGLRLLTLPRVGGVDKPLAGAEADLLVQRLREYFQYIVVDLGGVSQSDLAMRIASKAKKICVICDQSLPGVVATTELLRQLDSRKIARSDMALIVNRYDRNLELSAQHIADQLQLPLLMTIPERRVELLQAVNQGELLSPQSKREPYVQAIHKLVEILRSSLGLENTAPKGSISSLLQRMRG